MTKRIETTTYPPERSEPSPHCHLVSSADGDLNTKLTTRKRRLLSLFSLNVRASVP